MDLTNEIALVQSKTFWSALLSLLAVIFTTFGLSQYARLREDVEGIAWVENRGDPRLQKPLSFQVMACRNLPRALASFPPSPSTDLRYARGVTRAGKSATLKTADSDDDKWAGMV
jgi:hypothetical protein